MEVKLISRQDNILETLYTACRTCYSADKPASIFADAVEKDNKTKLKLIKKVISSGHHSTLEHIQFSWAIAGISRACSHQLVRHRHMSFSQQSQRYVEGFQDYVAPQKIADNEGAYELFEEAMDKLSKYYNDLIRLGFAPEDARTLLPNATTTNMVVSCNLRELIHVANLRLCSRAQREIRYLVWAMCTEVTKEEPWLKEFLVPKCERLGFCDEDKSCGRKDKLNR